MTPGPPDGKCANPVGGPGGMPLALRLNEGLGVAASRPRICSRLTLARWLKLAPCADRAMMRFLCVPRAKAGPAAIPLAKKEGCFMV